MLFSETWAKIGVFLEIRLIKEVLMDNRIRIFNIQPMTSTNLHSITCGIVTEKQESDKVKAIDSSL